MAIREGKYLLEWEFWSLIKRFFMDSLKKVCSMVMEPFLTKMVTVTLVNYKADLQKGSVNITEMVK